jgi:SAM-dependent methyltransferase
MSVIGTETGAEPVVANPPTPNYMHAGNAAARDLFNQRSVEQDAPLVAAHLRPGMRLVDFGCGAGSLTCGFASLLAPGDVLGIDSSEDAIVHARALAEQAGLANARFAVADINELNLPPAGFDVAHFGNVLRYLREPERAVQLAFGSLESGGLVAASEGYLAGNWAGGPHAEATMLVMRVLRDENKAQGGDPLIGGRLRALFRQAGFTRIASKPGYSAALSDAGALGAALRASWSANLRPLLMRHGIAAARCDQLVEQISIWAESEDSVAAIAQCAVVGWKP